MVFHYRVFLFGFAAPFFMNIEQIRAKLAATAKDGLSCEAAARLGRIFSEHTYPDSSLSFARLYEFYAMQMCVFLSNSDGNTPKGIQELLERLPDVECRTSDDVVGCMRSEILPEQVDDKTLGELALLTGLYCCGVCYHVQDADFCEVFTRSWCLFFSAKEC